MAISPQERTQLVRLARQAVEAKVCRMTPPQSPAAGGVLAETRGCFVTLTNGGNLRGCIGTFHPDRALAEMIVEMGAAAARDPRFVYHPITPPELPQLAVEVSVLSPLEETAEPERLIVGTHGVYITRGGFSGCFLPEVATDMGWNATEFLNQCCSGKAGLPGGAWRQPGTRVYLFTSEKFDR